MQSKAPKILLALILLLAVAALVIPGIVGFGVRDSTISNLMELIPPETRAQVEITETRFDSGWFSSSAQFDIDYQPLGVSDSFQLQLEFDIDHGPVLFTDSGPKLGLAYAEIRPEFSSKDFTKAMTQVPFDLPSVRIDLLAGLDQSLTISLSVAPVSFSESGTEVVFEGLAGSLVASPDQSAEFLLSMGALQAESEQAQLGFRVQGIEIESDTEQINNLLAPSNAQLIVPGLSSAGPLPFNVTDITADSRLRTSSAGPEQIDVYQRLHIASIESELPLASLSWTTEINEIQNQLIRSYYELLAELQEEVTANPGVLTTRTAELGSEMATLLLQNSLVFDNLIEANAYEGDHSVELDISWRGLPDVNSIAELDLNAAVAALEIQLNVALDLEAILRSPAAEMVDGFVQQGYITVDNGRILVNGSLIDSELTLNNEVIPLEQFF